MRRVKWWICNVSFPREVWLILPWMYLTLC